MASKNPDKDSQLYGNGRRRLVVVDFLIKNPCFSVMKILLSFKTTYLRLGFQQLLKLLTGLQLKFISFSLHLNLFTDTY